MHVVGVTDHLWNAGGAEISAQTILAGLADRSAVDHVTVVGVDSPDDPQLDFGDATVIGVEPPAGSDHLPDLLVDLVLERRLARAVERCVTADPEREVIHAHHRRSALAVSRLDVPRPTVVTVRDFWPACPISIYHVGGDACPGCDENLDACVAHQGWDGFEEPLVKGYLLAKRRRQRPALAAADCAVFISDHLRDRLSGAVNFSDRTATIYNPVEVDTDIDAVKFDGPTFVTASSLNESKGVDIAVRAMGQVRDEIPDATLVVFGDGPEREQLSALATDVAPDAVSFRGRVPVKQVHAAIAGATGTIFPSLWAEPFGRVTIESMMLETPVVGSDVGGIAEVVTDGETGLLFPPGDDAVLAECLRKLITDSDQRVAFTERAQKTAKRFSPAEVTAEHLSLYRSLIG